MSQSSHGKGTPEALLAQARQGDQEALGALLHLYRNYLHFLGRQQIRTTLKIAFDHSSLVQETVLEACRDFRRFRGATEAELMAWLRKILVQNLKDLARYHTAAKRDFRRLRSLEETLKRSSLRLHQILEGDLSSPSSEVARREQAVLTTDALARLPEHYQEVIELRVFDGLPFAEVAKRMGRTYGSAQKLLTRALVKFRSVMKEIE